MDIVGKFKETAGSVLPVMAIVLLLGFTVVPLDKYLLMRFVLGGLLLIAGLTIFLMGVDLGIQPIGERCGAELTKKRNLTLLLVSALVIGFLVTIAEPDIQVFGDQVNGIINYVNKNVFVFVIGAGVGLFLMLGLFRTVMQFSLKIVLLIAYLILFLITAFVPAEFIGIGFDSGGATTGPMTVPFILALGLGVSGVGSNGDKDSFGLTGVTSIGPVMAVLVYGLFLRQGQVTNDGLIQAESAIEYVDASGFAANVILPFVHELHPISCESFTSILPLLILFLVFQFTLLRMTVFQCIRIVIGLIYSFIGLTLFLLGVNGGFMPAGLQIGLSLGLQAVQSTGGFVLLIVIGLVLGAIVVCAEPAVWVLTEQVEQVSGGTIKRKVLLIFLSAGAALAIGLALCRAVCGFSLKWILVPGYALALLLMIFSPGLFTGIAFDSGGVASGPITSSFVLSFTLGASSAATGSNDAFGVIALVAMMPLIAVQTMGILFKKKMNASEIEGSK